MYHTVNQIDSMFDSKVIILPRVTKVAYKFNGR